MDLVVGGAVGGRVTQDHQWLKLGQRLKRLFALHFLRFIQNHNRAIAADHVNWPARLEVIQFIVYTAIILTGGIERLDVDNHNVDARI